jgi:hypothetical protein
VCAATGASRSRQDLHATRISRNASALPGHGRRRAAWPHMRVPPPTRRHHGETGTSSASHSTRPPSPSATADGLHIPQPGGGQHSKATPCATLLARRIRARRAHQVPSALCSRPPRPRWRRASPQGSTTYHCRVAIAARRAHTVPLARRDRPPQP